MAINIVAVVPKYKHQIVVQWALNNAIAAAGSYNYTLERSGSPEGPWEPINTTPETDVVMITDPYANLFEMGRDIYYRVVATNAGQPSLVYTSEPHNILSGFDRRRWLLWRKMNYDEELMLRKFNGVPVKVVKKMHWGTRCEECYDPISGQLIKSKCKACAGTGWTTGYYAPIDTMGHLKPSTPRTGDSNPAGITNVETTNALLLNYPRVNREDIIVEVRTNMRWRVDSMQPTELIRTPVHQDIVLQKIPRDAVEHDIDLGI